MQGSGEAERRKHWCLHGDAHDHSYVAFFDLAVQKWWAGLSQHDALLCFGGLMVG